jgi:hypothetical protein
MIFGMVCPWIGIWMVILRRRLWPIRDAMEEEFLREKMIARQKSKGKRELLNLQSSFNYGVASDSSRRRKGKGSSCRVVFFRGRLGYL